jgi:hypothetical protein
MVEKRQLKKTGPKEKRHSREWDWKHNKRGWPYKTDAPQNMEWKKDRAELFAENGNGWWWFVSNKINISSSRYKRFRRIKRSK